VIRGSVRDGGGRPVAGARVMVASAPGPVPDVAALTGPGGGFDLDVAGPGAYELLVVDDVHGARRVPVEVPEGGATAAGGDVEVEITLA
jgi:hypothetical protein